MTTSFFLNDSFQILERSPFHDNFQFHPSDSVLSVIDFNFWKVNLSSENYPHYSTKEIVDKIQTLKQKKPFGICVTTEDQIFMAKQYANFLYIPAEFCRQSSLLEAAKKSQLPFIVEKGSFLSPKDITLLCQKVEGADMALVECGSSFGYSNLVLDPRSLQLMKSSNKPFGVSISDLFCPESVNYTHRPKWLENKEFIDCFIKTGKAFGSSFFVVKKNGPGALDSNDVLKMVTK